MGTAFSRPSGDNVIIVPESGCYDFTTPTLVNDSYDRRLAAIGISESDYAAVLFRINEQIRVNAGRPTLALGAISLFIICSMASKHILPDDDILSGVVSVASIICAALVAWFLYSRLNARKKQVDALLQPWKANGVIVQYELPERYAPGALYFTLPTILPSDPLLESPQPPYGNDDKNIDSD